MLIDYRKINVYQGESLILQDINFHVDEGEFVYIIGKVGSGKSSLLETIYCELDIDATEGSTVEVLGHDLKRIKRKEIPALRREMGVIFQDFQLLHDRSVYKNLQFVLRATQWKDKNKINDRIEEVLKEVGMSNKKDKMPYELSGGEQQRIAIARALLNHPQMIIADEPTGNLDPDTAYNIISVLKKISQTGTAVIMSTHNIPMLDKFPGVVYQCVNKHIIEVTKEYNRINIESENDTTKNNN